MPAPDDRPGYDSFVNMEESRGPAAAAFAAQVLATTAPFRSVPDADLDVLDVGCGYGHTAAELARTCRSVRAIEPAPGLAARAAALHAEVPGLRVEQAGVLDVADERAYDLIVLDNVYEHLPDQPAALAALHRALRPGGVLYVLTPNRLWPIEAHYRLPFLAWLPLRAANAYLRASGRGEDYEDASYAPTARGLGKALDAAGFDWTFSLPADPAATMSGTPWHYALGMRALDRAPALWSISKALLAVAVRRA